MLKISWHFYILVFIVIFFQLHQTFFLTFIFILFHELAHVYVAKKFKLNFEKIIITPLGMIAIIHDIDKLYLYQKLTLVSVGVFLNLSMVIFFEIIYIFFNLDFAHVLKNINMSIIIFNLLPIFPLDGSRFILYLLGNKIGDLKALKVVYKISIIFSYIILLLGILQIILMPYNITLLCFAIYFIKTNKNNFIFFTMDFYKNLYLSNTYKNNKILKIKYIIIPKETKIKDLITCMSSDYYTIFKIRHLDNNNINNINNTHEFTVFNQDKILTYIEQNGIIDRKSVV